LGNFTTNFDIIYYTFIDLFDKSINKLILNVFNSFLFIIFKTNVSTNKK